MVKLVEIHMSTHHNPHKCDDTLVVVVVGIGLKKSKRI